MIDGSPSNNGRGSEAWSQSWAHFSVDRRSPGFCRVTFDHPPINTITATTVAELAELVGLIEAGPGPQRRRLRQRQPRFLPRPLRRGERRRPGPRRCGVGPTGMHAWLDLLVRLSRAPVVSIASIRGRARGAGSEFVLACDLRFASRENTLLGQFEVGIWCGPRRWSDGPAGPPRRSRPGARDPARRRRSRRKRAEQYGYVNRLVADDDLDGEVEKVAGPTLHASTMTRSRAPSRTSTWSPCPPTASCRRPLGRLSRAVRTRPAQQAQWARLQALGLNNDSDLERSLGRRVVESLPGA